MPGRITAYERGLDISINITIIPPSRLFSSSGSQLSSSDNPAADSPKSLLLRYTSSKPRSTHPVEVYIFRHLPTSTSQSRSTIPHIQPPPLQCLSSQPPNPQASLTKSTQPFQYPRNIESHHDIPLSSSRAYESGRFCGCQSDTFRITLLFRHFHDSNFRTASNRGQTALICCGGRFGALCDISRLM